MGGAFQTSRDIFNNPIWQDIPKFRIFFYIVGNAVFSHEGVRVANMLVKRGQFLRSYRNLCDDLQYIENRSIKKYSISVVSRKIESLVKEERLKIEDTELGTLFTVVNYDMYQGFDHYKKGELGTELEQGWNSDGTELERSGNNNNKDNKVKKDNKKTSSPKYEICDMELAELLFKKMKENNLGVKQPKLEAWANEVRLMRENDKRTVEQISYLINWTQEHYFWKTNILSITKLRKKWDQLVLQCKEDVGKRKGVSKQTIRKEDFNLDE